MMKYIIFFLNLKLHSNLEIENNNYANMEYDYIEKEKKIFSKILSEEIPEEEKIIAINSNKTINKDNNFFVFLQKIQSISFFDFLRYSAYIFNKISIFVSYFLCLNLFLEIFLFSIVFIPNFYISLVIKFSHSIKSFNNMINVFFSFFGKEKNYDFKSNYNLLRIPLIKTFFLNYPFVILNFNFIFFVFYKASYQIILFVFFLFFYVVNFIKFTYKEIIPKLVEVIEHLYYLFNRNTIFLNKKIAKLYPDGSPTLDSLPYYNKEIIYTFLYCFFDICNLRLFFFYFFFNRIVGLAIKENEGKMTESSLSSFNFLDILTTNVKNSNMEKEAPKLSDTCLVESLIVSNRKYAKENLYFYILNKLSYFSRLYAYICYIIIVNFEFIPKDVEKIIFSRNIKHKNLLFKVLRVYLNNKKTFFLRTEDYEDRIIVTIIDNKKKYILSIEKNDFEVLSYFSIILDKKEERISDEDYEKYMVETSIFNYFIPKLNKKIFILVLFFYPIYISFLNLLHLLDYIIYNYVENYDVYLYKNIQHHLSIKNIKELNQISQNIFSFLSNDDFNKKSLYNEEIKKKMESNTKTIKSKICFFPKHKNFQDLVQLWYNMKIIDDNIINDYINSILNIDYNSKDIFVVDNFKFEKKINNKDIVEKIYKSIINIIKDKRDSFLTNFILKIFNNYYKSNDQIIKHNISKIKDLIPIDNEKNLAKKFNRKISSKISQRNLICSLNTQGMSIVEDESFNGETITPETILEIFYDARRYAILEQLSSFSKNNIIILNLNEITLNKINDNNNFIIDDILLKIENILNSFEKKEGNILLPDDNFFLNISINLKNYQNKIKVEKLIDEIKNKFNFFKIFITIQNWNNWQNQTLFHYNNYFLYLLQDTKIKAIYQKIFLKKIIINIILRLDFYLLEYFFLFIFNFDKLFFFLKNFFFKIKNILYIIYKLYEIYSVIDKTKIKEIINDFNQMIKNGKEIFKELKLIQDTQKILKKDMENLQKESVDFYSNQLEVKENAIDFFITFEQPYDHVVCSNILFAISGKINMLKNTCGILNDIYIYIILINYFTNSIEKTLNFFDEILYLDSYQKEILEIASIDEKTKNTRFLSAFNNENYSSNMFRRFDNIAGHIKTIFGIKERIKKLIQTKFFMGTTFGMEINSLERETERKKKESLLYLEKENKFKLFKIRKPTFQQVNFKFVYVQDQDYIGSNNEHRLKYFFIKQEIKKHLESLEIKEQLEYLKNENKEIKEEEIKDKMIKNFIGAKSFIFNYLNILSFDSLSLIIKYIILKEIEKIPNNSQENTEKLNEINDSLQRDLENLLERIFQDFITEKIKYSLLDKNIKLNEFYQNSVLVITNNSLDKIIKKIYKRLNINKDIGLLQEKIFPNLLDLNTLENIKLFVNKTFQDFYLKVCKSSSLLQVRLLLNSVPFIFFKNYLFNFYKLLLPSFDIKNNQLIKILDKENKEILFLEKKSFENIYNYFPYNIGEIFFANFMKRICFKEIFKEEKEKNILTIFLKKINKEKFIVMEKNQNINADSKNIYNTYSNIKKNIENNLYISNLDNLNIFYQNYENLLKNNNKLNDIINNNLENYNEENKNFLLKLQASQLILINNPYIKCIHHIYNIFLAEKEDIYRINYFFLYLIEFIFYLEEEQKQIEEQEQKDNKFIFLKSLKYTLICIKNILLLETIEEIKRNNELNNRFFQMNQGPLEKTKTISIEGKKFQFKNLEEEIFSEIQKLKKDSDEENVTLKNQLKTLNKNINTKTGTTKKTDEEKKRIENLLKESDEKLKIIEKDLEEKNFDLLKNKISFYKDINISIKNKIDFLQNLKNEEKNQDILTQLLKLVNETKENEIKLIDINNNIVNNLYLEKIKFDFNNLKLNENFNYLFLIKIQKNFENKYFNQISENYKNNKKNNYCNLIYSNFYIYDKKYFIQENECLNLETQKKTFIGKKKKKFILNENNNKIKVEGFLEKTVFVMLKDFINMEDTAFLASKDKYEDSYLSVLLYQILSSIAGNQDKTISKASKELLTKTEFIEFFDFEKVRNSWKKFFKKNINFRMIKNLKEITNRNYSSNDIIYIIYEIILDNRKTLLEVIEQIENKNFINKLFLLLKVNNFEQFESNITFFFETLLQIVKNFLNDFIETDDILFKQQKILKYSNILKYFSKKDIANFMKNPEICSLIQFFSYILSSDPEIKNENYIYNKALNIKSILKNNVKEKKLDNHILLYLSILLKDKETNILEKLVLFYNFLKNANIFKLIILRFENSIKLNFNTKDKTKPMKDTHSYMNIFNMKFVNNNLKTKLEKITVHEDYQIFVEILSNIIDKINDIKIYLSLEELLSLFYAYADYEENEISSQFLVKYNLKNFTNMNSKKDIYQMFNDKNIQICHISEKRNYENFINQKLQINSVTQVKMTDLLENNTNLTKVFSLLEYFFKINKKFNRIIEEENPFSSISESMNELLPIMFSFDIAKIVNQNKNKEKEQKKQIKKKIKKKYDIYSFLLSKLKITTEEFSFIYKYIKYLFSFSKINRDFYNQEIFYFIRAYEILEDKKERKDILLKYLLSKEKSILGKKRRKLIPIIIDIVDILFEILYEKKYEDHDLVLLYTNNGNLNIDKYLKNLFEKKMICYLFSQKDIQININNLYKDIDHIFIFEYKFNYFYKKLLKYQNIIEKNDDELKKIFFLNKFIKNYQKTLNFVFINMRYIIYQKREGNKNEKKKKQNIPNNGNGIQIPNNGNGIQMPNNGNIIQMPNNGNEIPNEKTPEELDKYLMKITIFILEYYKKYINIYNIVIFKFDEIFEKFNLNQILVNNFYSTRRYTLNQQLIFLKNFTNDMYVNKFCIINDNLNNENNDFKNKLKIKINNLCKKFKNINYDNSYLESFFYIYINKVLKRIYVNNLTQEDNSLILKETYSKMQNLVNIPIIPMNQNNQNIEKDIFEDIFDFINQNIFEEEYDYMKEIFENINDSTLYLSNILKSEVLRKFIYE